MYDRFPELAPPEFSRSPTINEVESGEWCFPHLRPDESNMTRLDPDLPIASQFANMTPEYLWLQNDQQTIVALSTPHSHDPNHAFYDDLRSLYDQFNTETKGHERATLKEGRIWPQAELAGSDAEIINHGGDVLYLQSLANRHKIDCLSTEPIDDKEILAVMHNWPELRRAAVTYVKMRMLPQAYKRQQQDPPYSRAPILDYLRRFVNERRQHHGESWTTNHLYSINLSTGPGSLNSIGTHLTNAHGLRNDAGYTITGGDLAEGSNHRIVESPRKEVLDQIFRCTNTPVFHSGDTTYEDLCEVQKVAVLVNRLRDRRIAYLLADLGRKAVSYFWMSGPPHYEALVPGLYRMSTEQAALARHDLQAKLGLHAVRASSVIAHPILRD